MIKLKDILSENVWDRKFGQPLVTLTDVVKKHQMTEDDCGCNQITSCACESVTESTDEKVKAQKETQRVVKAEAKLRERMMKLEQIFLDDPRPENMKLAKDIKNSYKTQVTKFMRDTISYVKKMK